METLKTLGPLWSVATSVIALVGAAFMIGWHASKVQRAVEDNMAQNNANHDKQMAAIETQSIRQAELLGKIICLARTQLMATNDPGFKYTRQCEDEFS